MADDNDSLKARVAALEELQKNQSEVMSVLLFRLRAKGIIDHSVELELWHKFDSGKDLPPKPEK